MNLLNMKCEAVAGYRGHLLVPIITILLLIPALASALDCDNVEPGTLIPADGVCTGFTLDGDPDLPHGFTELAVFVNGDAAMYDQYGFLAAALQSYSVELDEVVTSAELKIFNQGNSENAQDLYYYTNGGTWSDVPTWAGSGVVRLRQNYGTTYLEFQEECFFVRIQVTGLETPAAASGAQCLGESVCAAIQVITPTTDSTWSDIKASYR
ncbi:MAG: hypothetical protein GY835_14180 [bacterium]|nr:hypothetical protein [bacterium]